MLSERERMIGARVREFRESLQIPRTRFALSLGFGGERIASYEGGRAALPYEVFKAIFTKYSINPEWLATGDGATTNGGLPYLGFLPADVTRGATFSKVYDDHISRFIARLKQEEEMDATQTLLHIREFLKEAASRPQMPENADVVIFGSLKSLAVSIKRRNARLDQVKRKSKKNKG